MTLGFNGKYLITFKIIIIEDYFDSKKDYVMTLDVKVWYGN